MSHLQEVTRWVAAFDPRAAVVPYDRKILTRREDVTGRQVLRVQEVYLLHRQLERSYDSFAACVRLGNRLTCAKNPPVFGDDISVLAEKARLVRVLPGEQGIYQLQLSITYTMEE